MEFSGSTEFCGGIRAKQRLKTLGIRNDFNFTLLELSLIEGIADLIASEVLTDKYILETKRAKYGESHEAELWEEFQPTMFSHNHASWIYSAQKENRPLDLGY